MVRVEVARVDIDRRELDFRIVQKKRRLPPPGKISRGKAKHLRALKSETKNRGTGHEKRRRNKRQK
jgi:hypothetical protein